MVRFALEAPELAERHWLRLMETDGGYGVYEETGEFREFTDDEFVREYTAFAIVFAAYFPADRVAAPDPDPLVDLPGAPGILVPRSSLVRLEVAGGAPTKAGKPS